MTEESIGKFKKSSRLNAKKEDKVELVVDKTWSTVPVLFVVVRSMLSFIMRRGSMILLRYSKRSLFTRMPKERS